VIDPSHNTRRRVVATLAALGAPLAVAHPALAAGATCPTPTPRVASPAVAPFGDSSLYVPVPGGSFEYPNLPAWTVTKGSIVRGNEPWHVGGPSEAKSLSLATKGAAESPTVCISSDQPSWRFFAVSRSHSRSAKLSVWARWQDAAGTVHTTPVTTLAARGYRAWAPSPKLALGSAINTSAAVDAHLFFAAKGRWQIDDVYVDPYAR
jgi:hypothetical protein